MTARCRLVLAGALALVPVACQPAARYPAPQPAESAEKTAETAPAHWAWLPVAERPDVPLRFVAESDPQWAALPQSWNHFPPLPAGMRTAHLGLPPLQAAAALALADAAAVIKIKVPRGLPDPGALIPESNPPTFGRWQLGKKIFGEPVLKADGDIFSCATCHQPGHGFAEARYAHVAGAPNTLSLLNVVYNRRQFGDGRVDALEETLARTLADEETENAEGAQSRIMTHRWGGLVKALAAQADYRKRFHEVFGIEQPTQDAIAKAIATYLRTLLAGDSLVDRAEAERGRRKATELAAEHFLPHLDDAALKRLEAEKLPKEDVARELARGARLFHGKARCAACHPGPLFTDHDFHNIGLGGSAGDRLAQVPVGLKEARFHGAFRTPTLRNLPRTAPYFHDGTRHDLREVIAFFNLPVDTESPYVARVLKEPGRTRLAEDEVEALVLFLRALDGVEGDVNDNGRER